MLKFVHGNLLDAPNPIIAHGCNAQGVMGAGVALAIKKRWPATFRDYEFALASGALQLGEVVWSWRDADQSKLVGHIMSQQNYGTAKNFRYASYDAIDKGLRLVAERSKLDFDKNPVAIPVIGAGLGGGRWSIISQIIEEASRDSGIDFHVYVLEEAEFLRLSQRELSLG